MFRQVKVSEPGTGSFNKEVLQVKHSVALDPVQVLHVGLQGAQVLSLTKKSFPQEPTQLLFFNNKVPVQVSQ